LGLTHSQRVLFFAVVHLDLPAIEVDLERQEIVNTPESGWKPDLLFAASLSAEM
jgi:hypothetical protein